MLNKLSFSVLLTTSLACFGQVTTTGGYATTSGPAVTGVPMSAANAPLIATPHIALPGSGPAVGAPVTNDNDSRVSSGPSVSNPNMVAPVAAESGTNATQQTINEQAASATGPATASAEPFDFGIQEFGSATPSARSRVVSLGEIARYYRAHHRPAVRTFNNDSIAQLTTTGLQLGPLGSNAIVAANVSPASAGTANASAQAAQAPPTLMARNQPPALPQSDQDTLPAQHIRPVDQSATAAQQRHASILNASATDENTATPSNANATSKPAVPASKNTANLPQTSSALPLLLLLGGAGLAGGTLWLLRR